MSFPNSMRPVLYLAIGLAVGGVGATLFRDSLPGAENTPEERVAQLEVDLKKARNEVISLRGADRRRSAGQMQDNLRALVGDFRNGRPVSPEDIFRAVKPLFRDLSPVFDRLYLRQEMRNADSMIGELTRKYDLNPAQQKALKEWFDRKVEGDAKRFSEMLASDQTTMMDINRSMRDIRWDNGLDGFMKGQLSGEKLATFEAGRLDDKVQRVQAEADMRVSRIDSIVGLDDRQRDQVFGIMARGSRDYDPSMELEGGAGDIGATPDGDRNQAMLSVLRPEQQNAWMQEQERRRTEAQRELEYLGLTLPPDWDPIED